MSFKKIPQAESGPIWGRFEATEAATELATMQLSPEQAIEHLQQQSLFIDMSNFIAHALPMRECLWWCILVLELRNSDWSALELDTLKHCKQWVLEPEEAKRRLLEQRVEKLGHDCAIGWLAQAVFWNGSGSIIAPDLPLVMPVDYLYAKAAAGAINTAAVIPSWDGYAGYYEKVAAMGVNIAKGGRGELSA